MFARIAILVFASVAARKALLIFAFVMLSSFLQRVSEIALFAALNEL
jgi:hypothetical protein